MGLTTLEGMRPRSAEGQAGTRSWIDAPLDGSSLPLGPVEVVSHSTSSVGLAQIELTVDGMPATVEQVAVGQGILLTARQTWEPTAAGNYTLMVRAREPSGGWGDHAKVVVTVGGAPTPTRTPRLLLTPTSTPRARAAAGASPTATLGAAATAEPTGTLEATTTAEPTGTPESTPAEQSVRTPVPTDPPPTRDVPTQPSDPTAPPTAVHREPEVSTVPPTDTAKPLPTDTPVPTPTSTPVPPTAVPTATRVPTATLPRIIVPPKVPQVTLPTPTPTLRTKDLR